MNPIPSIAKKVAKYHALIGLFLWTKKERTAVQIGTLPTAMIVPAATPIWDTPRKKLKVFAPRNPEAIKTFLNGIEKKIFWKALSDDAPSQEKDSPGGSSSGNDDVGGRSNGCNRLDGS